eukprot:GHVS01044944.1.p1 GENE.GHVS01044944.1~~GHVS01044944.1.p1  ORF type:complete len:178 (+),score=22.73 GHVS01044944.1:198-731(+)
MEQLSSEKKLICKEYGKFKVYLISQQDTSEEEPEPTEQTAQLQREVGQLEGEVRALRETVAEAAKKQAEIDDVHNLREKIKKAEEVLRARKEVSKDNITPEQVASTKVKHLQHHSQWNRLKNVCTSLLSTLGQRIDLSEKQLILQLGIDSDEDCVPMDVYSHYGNTQTNCDSIRDKV